MDLSARQRNILEKIVKEYIRSAEPISSEFLKIKYRLDLSSATIRSEMQRLTDMGYLHQPHTSAGRVPTDRGYRYLVDFLIEKRINNFLNEEIKKELRRIREAEDCVIFLQEISNFLSSFSSGLIFSYFPENELRLSQGWISVFKDPEFSDINYTRKFLSMVDFFEKNIRGFDAGGLDIKVYIGSEIPIPKSKDFSIVIFNCPFEDKEAVLAILGPKRMPYEKNIPIINSIVNILKENCL